MKERVLLEDTSFTAYPTVCVGPPKYHFRRTYHVVLGDRSAPQAVNREFAAGEWRRHLAAASQHALGRRADVSSGCAGAERGRGRLARDTRSVWLQRLALDAAARVWGQGHRAAASGEAAAAEDRSA